MKINDANSSSVNNSRIDQTSGVDAAKRAQDRKLQQQGDGGGDRVEISALSDQLRTLATNSPDRADRVEQLSAEYRAGRYQADSLATGKGIIRDAVARGASAGSGAE